MRYTPAAIALALLAAVTASVGHGAAYEPDPRAAALVAQGRGALAGGEVQAAIDSFEAALAVDPAYSAVYIELAAAVRQQDLAGKAIHYYRKTLAREPDNLAAISGEGAAMVEQGAIEKARRNLARLEALCGTGCDETRELAAAIESGARAPLVTAEVAPADDGVTQN